MMLLSYDEGYDDPALQRIISTFKFIETVSNANNPNSKTYKNEQYGFEFNYPPEYALDDKVQKRGFYEYEITNLAKVEGTEKEINRASLEVSADDTPYNKSVCLLDNDIHPQTITTTKLINGNRFYVFQDKVGDAAMGGDRGLLSQYRTLHNNYCYILDFYVYWYEVGGGYSSAGKNDATPKEIEAQNKTIKKHQQILDKIVASFKFL